MLRIGWALPCCFQGSRLGLRNPLLLPLSPQHWGPTRQAGSPTEGLGPNPGREAPLLLLLAFPAPPTRAPRTGGLSDRHGLWTAHRPEGGARAAQTRAQRQEHAPEGVRTPRHRHQPSGQEKAVRGGVGLFLTILYITQCSAR